MSSKVIVLWGFIVICLVISIFTIGSLNKEQFTRSYKFDKDIKVAVKKYIVESKKEPPFTINSEELIEKNYLKELAYDNKICKATIKVNKVLFFNTYDIKYTCEIKIVSDNED